MLQIKPKEYLPIVRQLADPSDTTTYYVRAYVYKHRGETETLLATLDMEDQGSQRFTYHYEVPADPEGQGYYLSILTRVFTDSGYTTESPLYGRTNEIYLVAERWSMAMRGGGAPGVDYKRVRKIIQEEVGKVEKPNDFSSILAAIKTAQSSIENIKIVESKEVDLAPVIAAIEALQTVVKAIKQPEKVDLSPVISSIEKLKGHQDFSIKDLNAYIKKIKDVLTKAIQSLTERTEKVEKVVGSSPMVRMIPSEEKKPRKRFFRL